MKIAIYHASAGYGHQKVAEVIRDALLAKGVPPQDIRVEDALDYTSPVFRTSYPAIYYYCVKWFPGIWGWFYEVLDHLGIYACIRPIRSFFNRLEGLKLLAEVKREKPDHIICTHFFSAELFSRAKKEGRIDSKITVVITDFAPHTFWVHPATDYYWVMTEDAKSDLIRRGIPAEKVQAGGIPVNPQFKPTGKKEEILKREGFDPSRFTVLLTSGSFGLAPQGKILRAMEQFKDRVQCFVVCGNNKQLKDELDRERYAFPVKIYGFINFMPDLMEASDLVIAKSGGATTVETLAKGLPMIIFKPIPGQEKRNADYLKAKHASFGMEEPEQAEIILKNIFDHPHMINDKKGIIREIARPESAGNFADFILNG